jgi:hypothetical protein
MDHSGINRRAGTLLLRDRTSNQAVTFDGASLGRLGGGGVTRSSDSGDTGAARKIRPALRQASCLEVRQRPGGSSVCRSGAQPDLKCREQNTNTGDSRIVDIEYSAVGPPCARGTPVYRALVDRSTVSPSLPIEIPLYSLPKVGLNYSG